MSDKQPFIDTNILVYAHDADAGQKHDRCRELVRSLWSRPYPPVISTQVIQELYVTLARKGVTKPECRRVVQIYFDWEIVEQSLQLVDAAMTLRERFDLSLWDSLIVAAAQRANADVLWSEDLQHGQRFDHVTIMNPML